MSTNTDPDQGPLPVTADTFIEAIDWAEQAGDKKQRKALIQMARTRHLVAAFLSDRVSARSKTAIETEATRRKQTPEGRVEQDRAVIDISKETGEPLKLEFISDAGIARLLKAMQEPEEHGIDPSEVEPQTLKGVEEHWNLRCQQAKDRHRQLENLRLEKKTGVTQQKERRGPRNQKPKKRR